MELIISLVVGAAFVFFIHRVIKANEGSLDVTASSSVEKPVSRRSGSHDELWDDDPDYKNEPAWSTREYEHGASFREEGFDVMPKMSDIVVAGINHYDGRPVIEQNRDLTNALSAKREPTNPFDRHAIAVFCGTALMGYLPREHTATLSGYSADMPILIEARASGRKTDGSVFLAVNVVVPEASARDTYKI